MAIVTLTTDFGATDSYVAQMKGVLLGLAPDVRLVDLCHEVPAHDVAAGAWLLETAYRAFPPGTIHLAVVDPGVGTPRPAIAAVTGRCTLVGPDNGLLSRVLRREPPLAVHRLGPGTPPPGAGGTTFEGRDRFAPAAARLAAGTPIGELGPAADAFERLPVCEATPRRGAPATVPVVAVDRFGNVVLDIDAARLGEALGAPPAPGSPVRVETPLGVVDELRATYEGGAPGGFLVVNSAGYLEIALDRGRADRHFGLRRGSTVSVGVL